MSTLIDNVIDNNENDQITYLRSTGRVLNQHMRRSAYGKLSVLISQPLGENSEPYHFHNVAFNEKSGEIALSDEKGQIFYISLPDNKYQTIRIQTRAISAMSFVHSRIDQLVVAFESGTVVLLDLTSKQIIGNICPSNPYAVRVIKCHPGQSKIIMASDDGTLTMWNLTTYQCLKTLDLKEGIVDVSFEANGDLIAIALEKSGIFLYRSNDCQLVLQCQLPVSERRPKWTAYQVFCNPSTSSSVEAHALDIYVVVAGDNGMLYYWTASAVDLRAGPRFAKLVGVIELPVQMKMAIAIEILGDYSLSPRFAIYSTEGAVLLVDLEAFSPSSSGSWTIVADIPSSSIHGSASKNLLLSSVLVSGDIKKRKGRGSMFGAKADIFVIVCQDGATRIYDSEAALGNGTLCGTFLRTRAPHTVVVRMNDDTQVKKSKNAANEAAKSGEPFEPWNKIDEHEKKLKDMKRLSQATSKTTKTVSNDVKSMAVKMAGKPMPLYELSQLTQQDRRVTETKLKTYFSANGEFPDRYRPLIWRFLLKLPENSEAFASLVRRGVHPAYENLHDVYPVRARRIYSRLQGICSQMAFWSPIFAEVSYLPCLAFPFVIMFNNDELALLETVMTIVLWWGFSWQSMFPNPPVHFLDSIDVILKLYDSTLYNHLHKMDASPGLMGWAIVSNMFTEVLGRSDWLKLMDFMFLHFEEMPYVLMAPVAIMIQLKPKLMGCYNSDAAFSTVRVHQSVRIEAILTSMTNMLYSTHPKYLTAVSIPKAPSDDAHRDPMSNFDPLQKGKNTVVQSGGNPIYPLPKGRYPAYDGYPKFIVDWQLQEREVAMGMLKTEHKKESALEDMEEKMKAIEKDHQKWMAAHEAATAKELEQRRIIMEKEKQHLIQLQTIEEEISKQRIGSLKSLEKAAQDEMLLVDKIASEARVVMSESEAHMKEKLKLGIDIRKHREMAEAAEATASERIREMYVQRTRDEYITGLQQALKAKEEELEARDKILQEKWTLEDEELRVQRALREAHARGQVEDEILTKLHEDMASRLQKLHLEREAKIIEVERTRAIRLAKEHAQEAVASSQRSLLNLHKHEYAAIREQEALLAERSSKTAQEKILKTVEMIRKESDKILESERTHLMKYATVRQQEKQAQIYQTWTERQGQHMEEILQTENQVQDHLIKLKEAVITSDSAPPPPPPVIIQKEEILDATKRKMQDVSDGITQQQRAEFDRIRKSATEPEEKKKSTEKDDSNDDIPSISSSVKDAMDVLLPGSSKRSSIVPTSPSSYRIVGDTPSDSEEDSVDLNALLGNNNTKIRRNTQSDPSIAIPQWGNNSRSDDIANMAKRSIEFLSSDNTKKASSKTKKEASIFDED